MGADQGKGKVDLYMGEPAQGGSDQSPPAMAQLVSPGSLRFAFCWGRSKEPYYCTTRSKGNLHRVAQLAPAPYRIQGRAAGLPVTSGVRIGLLVDQETLPVCLLPLSYHLFDKSLSPCRKKVKMLPEHFCPRKSDHMRNPCIVVFFLMCPHEHIPTLPLCRDGHRVPPFPPHFPNIVCIPIPLHAHSTGKAYREFSPCVEMAPE